MNAPTKTVFLLGWTVAVIAVLTVVGCCALCALCDDGADPNESLGARGSFPNDILGPIDPNELPDPNKETEPIR